MMEKSTEELLREVEELSRRLEESEQILHAIQTGAVDAVVVSGTDTVKIFTLQGAEHPYRVLVETMSEGALTLSPEGTILYCNSMFASLVEVPLENIIGSSVLSYLARDHDVFLPSVMDRCIHGCEKLEVSLVSRSGGHIPVLISCSAAELTGSQTLSMIVTDISARKQTERTILRLNRLYAMLSATNHAIVHAGDRVAIFHEFCRVAVQLGGFRLAWVGVVEQGAARVGVAAASGEVAYLDGVALYTDINAEGMAPVALSISDGSYYICNDFTKDDRTRPWYQRAHAHGLHAMASIAIKQDAEVVGALALYADEEEFFDRQQVELLQQMGEEVSFALDKLHQSALRDSVERALQDESLERLRAVEELRKSEQLLIHQSRQAALGEMIGNIAHQWRQPLNALGLLVQQGPLCYSVGEVNQQYMEQTAAKAMELIEHMSRTIDDFRNFFKPDKKKVPFKVKAEVAKTLSLMEGSFQGQQIVLEVEVKADPVVVGYPNEFSQVLLNILINARDALTERRVQDPKVWIRVASEDGRTVVTVADNAGGVPEEIIEKIFDPYFTTKGPQAGTGVGLFMSKTIIEKNMGGRLTVRNTGPGAEFRIEI